MRDENNIKLPLTLNKRNSSVLDGLVLLEYLPIERIKALLVSNLLLLSWGEDYNWDFHKKLIMEQYKSEKDMIATYLSLYKDKLNAVSVKYVKPRHKWGRAFPLKSMGLSCIRRVIRNSLIDDIYYDLDISNAQPQIIRNLCESNNIPCPMIKRYCKERPEIKKIIAEHYNVSENTVKELFIRLCFFGSFNGWTIENKIQDKEPLEFITLFERELKDIADRIRKENSDLYESSRKKKDDDNREKKENKVLGTFFALYNQEYESRIVESVLCYLINSTDLMKYQNSTTPVGTYEYDGIKLLKSNVDNYEGGLEAVVALLNEKTYELTGFQLEWAAKPYEDVYDLNEWIGIVAENEKPNEELMKDMGRILKAIKDYHVGICETLLEILPNHFIYSVDKNDGSKGEWYGWNGKRWEKSDAPLRKAIIYEVEKHWNSIMDKWNEKYGDNYEEKHGSSDSNHELWAKTRKEVNESISTLKSASEINNIVSVARTLMANYNLEFDTKEDLFGCENGVIDIAEECFRSYRFDDYVTWSCGYDFRPFLLDFNVETGMEEVMVGDEKVMKSIYRKVKADEYLAEDKESFEKLLEIYKLVFPDENLRNYFFKVISTGMSGRAIEKFFVFNGGGRNGKGMTNEFLAVVLGDYYGSISPLVFNENQKNKNSAGANPEIAGIDKKRYVVTKEPQKDALLHNNIIKDFTGGGCIKARMNYSNKTTVKLYLTLVMECNVKPNFSEVPKDADAERINDILFGSKFCNDEKEWDKTTGQTNHTYPLDTTLKVELKEKHRNTMLNILLSNLLMVKEKNYDVDSFKPESVKQRSLTYLQDSYDIHTIFTSLFEKRIETNAKDYVNWKGDKVDEDWTVAKVISCIMKSKEFNELPKSKKREYKKENIEQFFKTNSFYKSSIYTDNKKHALFIKGWRLKLVDEGLDEDNN
jgi:phage/plasmid-associated DNA primase